MANPATPGKTPQTRKPRWRMRDTRDLGAAPSHDADSMAAMRSVETERHIEGHQMYNAIVRVILPAVIGALIGGGAGGYLPPHEVTAGAWFAADHGAGK